MTKEYLFGKTLSELADAAKKCGLPSFAGKQIAEWLYKKHVSTIDEMWNISLKNRELLKEHFEMGVWQHCKVQESVDGTKKYLFPTHQEKFIESAYIPDDDRATLCVSSQVGCKMGCLFCMTGKQGFQAHLSTGEILNQIRSLPERDKLTNIVYMGMGEPFDNVENVLKSLDIITADYGYAWSPKRVTVSTIGVIPGMKEFLNRSKCHLAISLHSPFDEERKGLMPIQRTYPIQEVLSVIRGFDFGLQRRVSLEYIMFKDVNDTPRHVKELARILNGIRCRINLIRFHPVPEVPLLGSDDVAIKRFQEGLNEKGIVTTIRASRGLDIFAACGLLSTKEMVKK
ncbi:MAG: 23S rRNA (adenine(2503)-C(2))-methyltransferase RlmN [Bacteroidota bacterium]|nr:23S rRNA (adenine(2503)-C(2))-methyltransferase RlmN [Bacteroidota bacterium]